jgi:hypothetical protein
LQSIACNSNVRRRMFRWFAALSLVGGATPLNAAVLELQCSDRVAFTAAFRHGALVESPRPRFEATKRQITIDTRALAGSHDGEGMVVLQLLPHLFTLMRGDLNPSGTSLLITLDTDRFSFTSSLVQSHQVGRVPWLTIAESQGSCVPMTHHRRD